MIELSTRAGACLVRVTAALVIGGWLAVPAIAQRAVGDRPLRAFESAVVEQSRPASPRTLNVAPRTGDFTAENVSLAELVAFAYGVRLDQVVDLPAWAASSTYHVQAQAPDDLEGTDVQLLVEAVRPLVAGLLFDYFALEAHRGQSPLYVLDQAGGGSRLRESADQRGAPGVLAPNASGLGGERVRAVNIVMALESLIGRPVLDHTGLAKRYDVDFRWDPNEHDPQQLAAELQRQLGLTLRAVPVDVLIVDRATELKARAAPPRG
ncbi:MAG TPA: TIGR03435 family protein [Gammaproteobacteria bacterium]|nr:TIGR03435 family protein [Gammaproteobacteria bacterium]